MDKRVETVIALMKADLRQQLPLRKLATSVDLSPTRLSSLFKSELGIPPIRFLRRLRMRDAEILLATTFMSIKEVMGRVGFNDESHFVRDFKRINGMTPTQFRIQHLAPGRVRKRTRRKRKD
jgi:transcriptional regulator GlxA family with amidase domain